MRIAYIAYCCLKQNLDFVTSANWRCNVHRIRSREVILCEADTTIDPSAAGTARHDDDDDESA